jgi:pimeloyl-ACP methyl ester carboxylesterase
MSKTGIETTRRHLVAGAGAAAIASTAGTTTGNAQSTSKTFVLVHGAWHGGWCWRRVADLLEKKGHKVYTPTLTGLCDRSHLLDSKTNLSTHITDVANLIAWESLKDIVLVGHSYGGFVISGVAEKAQPAISSIVYLDAFLPDNGEALIDAVSGSKLYDAIQGAIQKGDLTIAAPKSALFQVNEKDRAWVDEKCTPQPTATLSEKVALTGARDRIAKRAYIRAKGYASPGFDRAQAKAQAASGFRVYEMPCGHDAMVDMPDRLTDILLEVA